MKTNNMRLWVDFNNVRNDDTITADLKNAEYYFRDANGFETGMVAELFDGDDNTCLATVVSFEEEKDRLTLRIGWDSWTPGERQQIFEPKLNSRVYFRPGLIPYS